MEGAEVITKDDITVTSATQSEADVRKHLDAPADQKVEAKAEEGKVAETPKAGDAPPADAAVEQEANSDKPDPEVSDAARTMRASRPDARRARMREDIALYEDNLRLMGVTVPPAEVRTYPNVQAEIDALTRRRHDLLRATNTALKTPRPVAPRAPVPPADKPVDAAPAAPAAPDFKFPTRDEWFALPGHADKVNEDYDDARTDARYAFNQQREQTRVDGERAARAAAERGQQFEAAETAFRVDKPDYDDAISKPMFTDAQLASPQYRDLAKLTQKDPKLQPALLYYLATHPDDVTRLMAARTYGDLTEEFGVIKHQVRTAQATPPSAAAEGDKKPDAAASSTPPKPAEPLKPMTSAPAPLNGLPGGASAGRSRQAMAEDSDDADEYIAAHQPALLKRFA